MKSEHEFTKGANPLLGDKDTLWVADSVQGSESEVNGFLYSLVRLIKPQFAIETGSYKGDGTIMIAQAIGQNGYGRMLSCDTDPEMARIANEKIKEVLPPDKGFVLTCKGIDLIKQCGSLVDFAFIDSSPVGKDRLEEAQELVKHLPELAIFCLHDTAPHHQGVNGAAEAIARIKGITRVYFNCPRGLTLFQKVW